MLRCRIPYRNLDRNGLTLDPKHRGCVVGPFPQRSPSGGSADRFCQSDPVCLTYRDLAIRRSLSTDLARPFLVLALYAGALSEYCTVLLLAF